MSFEINFLKFKSLASSSTLGSKYFSSLDRIINVRLFIGQYPQKVN